MIAFSDWILFFWPQISQPWSLWAGVFNLPWLFIALQPLRIVGCRAAIWIMQGLTVAVTVRLGQKMGVSVLKLLMVLISPPVLWCVWMGQIDGLILAAYLLPPFLASFLALCKPQTALAALVHAARRNWLVPVLVAVLVITAWLVWRWPFSTREDPAIGNPAQSGLSNWSLWPVGLLLAPFLLSQDKRFGMLVSPFLFPYVGVHSLIGPLLAVATLPWPFFLGIWCLLWVRWAAMIVAITP